MSKERVTPETIKGVGALLIEVQADVRELQRVVFVGNGRPGLLAWAESMAEQIRGVAAAVARVEQVLSVKPPAAAPPSAPAAASRGVLSQVAEKYPRIAVGVVVTTTLSVLLLSFGAFLAAGGSLDLLRSLAPLVQSLPTGVGP